MTLLKLVKIWENKVGIGATKNHQHADETYGWISDFKYLNCLQTLWLNVL